jgi:hypothetical protein
MMGITPFHLGAVKATGRVAFSGVHLDMIEYAAPLPDGDTYRIELNRNGPDPPIRLTRSSSSGTRYLTMSHGRGIRILAAAIRDGFIPSTKEPQMAKPKPREDKGQKTYTFTHTDPQNPGGFVQRDLSAESRDDAKAEMMGLVRVLGLERGYCMEMPGELIIATYP